MCFKDLLSTIVVIFAIFVSLTIGLKTLHHANDKPVCSKEMFENDTNALLACSTLDALQHNWFPSPIAGLYDYLEWNGFDGFWQNGAVLLPMVDYMRYTNSTRYYTFSCSFSFHKHTHIRHTHSRVSLVTTLLCHWTHDFYPTALKGFGVLFSPMASGWAGGRSVGRAGGRAGGGKYLVRARSQ